MSSLGVYGVVLAGWSSGSNYPLLGAVRSTAQMISYEVGMGLALVAVLMYSGHLRMSEIVAQQDKVWNVIPQFPAFVIYLIAGLAETNRPPFDLPEAETELVAGFHTEYSGIKFAMFYLGEYVNTVTVAAVAVTLFLGGWRGPGSGVPAVAVAGAVVPAQGPLIVYLYIWIRATLPRMRYDRLMAFGWKVLIPFGLVWVLATGAVVVLPDVYGRRVVIAGARCWSAPCSRSRSCGRSSRRSARPERRGGDRDERGDPATIRSSHREEPGRPSGAGRFGSWSIEGHGHRLEADVPPRQHRAVPDRDRAAARAVAHRTAPAEQARERPGEVHRVRAVRVRMPGRRDLGRGRRQRSREPDEPRASATRRTTRSTTCAASCAASASRPARPARSRSRATTRCRSLARGGDPHEGAAARAAAAARHRPGDRGGP